MKWRDHKRISYYVCKRVGLSDEVAKKVAEASILPDKEPDYVLVRGKKRTYRKRVAHHSVEGVKVGFKYLKKARSFYVKGLDFEEPLGRALHYFQDYAVSDRSGWFVFSWKSHEKHDERENSVSFMNIRDEVVEKGLKDRVLPSQFEGVVYVKGRKEEGREILDVATYLTALAVKLVVDPDIPEDITERYSKRLKVHLAMVLLVFYSVSLLVSVGLGWSAILGVFWGLIGGYIAHKVDIPFHCLRLDYKWMRGEF